MDTDGCPDGSEPVASRFDTDDGGWCSRKFNSGLHDRFKCGLCCPKTSSFKQCEWTTQSTQSTNDISGPGLFQPDRACVPRKCGKTKTKIAEAYEPAPLNPHVTKMCNGDCTIGDQCSKYPIYPEYNAEFYLCCDPPSEYDERWPVPPSHLWEDAYDGKQDDVAWAFADNTGNNNKASDDEPVEENPAGKLINNR